MRTDFEISDHIEPGKWVEPDGTQIKVECVSFRFDDSFATDYSDICLPHRPLGRLARLWLSIAQRWERWRLGEVDGPYDGYDW